MYTPADTVQKRTWVYAHKQVQIQCTIFNVHIILYMCCIKVDILRWNLLGGRYSGNSTPTIINWICFFWEKIELNFHNELKLYWFESIIVENEDKRIKGFCSSKLDSNRLYKEPIVERGEFCTGSLVYRPTITWQLTLPHSVF